MIRMKSRESIKSGVYELLDWLERKRSQHIHLFWSCIFKETILTQYPQLKLLRNSLMDGERLSGCHGDSQYFHRVPVWRSLPASARGGHRGLEQS